MKKVVTWPEPKITSANRRPGTYNSYQEFLVKANAVASEQNEANEFVAKAFPMMSALLDYKLANQEPLMVMRPLSYQTSDILKADEDDGFYRNASQRPQKFIDVTRMINPGTQLVLKSIQPSMQQFIFVDGMGNEHEISFQDRKNLMSQTNIFEEIKSYLESKGE